MAIFSNLGQVVNVPSLSAITSSALNTGASSILNYATQNFKLPTASLLTAEAAAKVNDTGQTSNFKSVSLNSPYLSQSQQSGVPANLIATTNDTETNELKVTIRQLPEISGSPNELVFNVMPRIDEAGSADYEQLALIHHPGAIQKYRNSSARTWGISGRLVSRTSEEASTNLAIINMIRAWRMPFYGEGTAANQETSRMLGSPPPILTLSAYGPSMIGPVKCVLTNYNWNFDNALDYIPTLEGNPFPVILDISLSLVEAWSPIEYSGFNLMKYKMGDLS